MNLIYITYDPSNNIPLLHDLFPTNLLHDHILTATDKVPLRLHDSLQELKILNVAPLSLNALHEVLDDTLSHLRTQWLIILEDWADCLRL